MQKHTNRGVQLSNVNINQEREVAFYFVNIPNQMLAE